jgi:hypothetical protein
MDAQGIVQLIAAILGAGAITAVVNGIFGRKKMSADVVKTINEAAGSVVERIEDDNARLREENGRLHREVEAAVSVARRADDHAYSLDRRAQRLAEFLREYMLYARRQSDVIRSLGGTIEDPPEVPSDLLTSERGPTPTP